MCVTGGGGGGGDKTYSCLSIKTHAFDLYKVKKVYENEGTPVFEIIVGPANLLTINLGTHRSRPLMQPARLTVVCDFD